MLKINTSVTHLDMYEYSGPLGCALHDLLDVFKSPTTRLQEFTVEGCPEPTAMCEVLLDSPSLTKLGLICIPGYQRGLAPGQEGAAQAIAGLLQIHPALTSFDIAGSPFLGEDAKLVANAVIRSVAQGRLKTFSGGMPLHTLLAGTQWLGSLFRTLSPSIEFAHDGGELPECRTHLLQLFDAFCLLTKTFSLRKQRTNLASACLRRSC